MIIVFLASENTVTAEMRGGWSILPYASSGLMNIVFYDQFFSVNFKTCTRKVYWILFLNLFLQDGNTFLWQTTCVTLSFLTQKIKYKKKRLRPIKIMKSAFFFFLKFFPKADVQRCLVKNVFLKISQNAQERACVSDTGIFL